MRSACDNTRRTTGTKGTQRSLSAASSRGCRHASAQLSTLDISWSGAEIELPTFRFSGWHTPTDHAEYTAPDATRTSCGRSAASIDTSTRSSVRSRRRTRCVPDRSVNRGDSRSLTDTRARRLTCARADQRPCTRSLPSWYRAQAPKQQREQQHHWTEPDLGAHLSFYQKGSRGTSRFPDKELTDVLAERIEVPKKAQPRNTHASAGGLNIILPCFSDKNPRR